MARSRSSRRHAGDDRSKAGNEAGTNANPFVTYIVDTGKATYATTAVAFAYAASGTDIFTITGSATKTIRILRISVTGTQTTGAMRDVLLIKRSAANTGGTSATPTIAPYDSNSSAATAVVRNYTANPSALGASVGTIRAEKFFLECLYQEFEAGLAGELIDTTSCPGRIF
jgi:hypothetical protein